MRGRTQLGPALALIHGGEAPTRAALGAGLGVTRATAGAVAAELQALGLIRVDSAPGGGTLGRPSRRLTIAPGGPVALAAQIHPDGFQVALVAQRSPWGRGSSVPVLGCALDNGSLIGAAELAWQPILDDPALLEDAPAPGSGNRARPHCGSA